MCWVVVVVDVRHHPVQLQAHLANLPDIAAIMAFPAESAIASPPLVPVIYRIAMYKYIY
jgi:hypothetical protein